MKKSIFLFFAAILCATSAWAGWNLPANGYIYFVKPAEWTYAQFMIGHGGWSTAYGMTKITNTNSLYYVKTAQWNGYDKSTFLDASGSWGDDGSNPADRKKYGSHSSDVYSKEIITSSQKYGLFVATYKDTHSATLTFSKGNSYTIINKTQTIKVQLKDGSNWVDATVVPADLKASTYALTSATGTGAQSASLAKESTTISATVSAAYSAKVTLSCTNVLDGYVFEGWYDANGNKITSYTVSDAHTVYARFIQSAEETNEVTVTYMCGTTSVATAVTEFVGVETEKSFTAPTNITGYKFTNWTIGAGIDLKAGTASDATITVVSKSASSNYTLVANYEEVIETIYFINTGKWNVVNLHRWNGTATATAWPGEAMTSTGEKIGEYDVYSFTAQQGAFANVIFTNKNTGSDQTDDLTWTAGKYYIYNYGGKTGWYTKAEAEELLVVPVVTHDIVVKAVAPEVWNSGTISIHYWGDGISATAKPVATEKEGNWNKYTIKEVPEGTSVNVIFINGANWSNNANQTANITGITEDKCFQISATKLDSEGKCTVKEVECDATIEPEVDVYTIMGAGELGLSWDLAKTGNDMTKQADGTYTLVKEGLDLATTGSYEYKVVKNHSWDWSIPSGNTNQTLKVDKDGTYTVTFTLSADKKKLTADALCTAEKEVILDCSVAGTINLVGGTADFTDKLAMTYDEGTKTYSKTFTALAAGNYQMKVVYGSDWLGYDKLTKPVPANVTEGDDKKIKFSLAEAGDVTVTYHATNGIGLTGNFAAPAPVTHTYTIAGDAALCGEAWNWELESNDMTNNGDGTYTWTKAGVTVEGEISFKVFVDHKSETAYPAENWVIKPENYEGVGVYDVTITFTESSKNVAVALTKQVAATEVKTIFIEEGLEYSVNGTTVTITGLYNDELFELEISDCDINNLEDQTCPITMLIGEFGANGYVENQNATVAVWFSGYIQVTATGLQDYDNSNITYNIDITAAPPAEEGLSEINVEVYDAVCTIDEDNMLTMLSTTAGVQVNVYNFDRTVNMAAYDYELYTYDGMASGNTQVAVDGNTVSIYVETTGEDNDGNEIPVIAFVSGELPAAEEEDPTQSQEVDIMVTDLVVEDNVVMGTGSNFTFVLTLVDYAGEDGTYVLSDESFVRSGMSLRGYAATGSLTKAVDEYYGTYFRGTIQATVGETPFTFNLTMVSEVAKEENIAAAATVTYNEENDVVFSANWNGTPISITLEGFENVAEKQYGELTLSIGTGEDEFYAFGEPIAYVDGGEISIEGEFYSYFTETTYNVALWGTLPVEETPDYTRSVTPGHYGTICLPYASSNYTGMELYEVSWLQKNGETPVNLYLDQLAADAQLEAGKPYIFRATSTELTVTYTGAAVTEPVAGANGLTGSFVEIPAGGVLTGNYVVAQNKFWTATADAYAAANRAYIDKAKVPYTEQKQIPGRRRVALGTSGENAETGIDNIITTDTPVKVIENGQLIIIRDGEMYNAQGQKL